MKKLIVLMVSSFILMGAMSFIGCKKAETPPAEKEVTTPEQPAPPPAEQPVAPEKKAPEC